MLWMTLAASMSVAVMAAVAAAGPPRLADQVIPVAAIPGVVASGAMLRVLATGLEGTEGAIALPDGSVVFCEFNASRLVRIDSAGHFSTYLRDGNRPIGLGYDTKGRLIAAESLDPRLEVLAPDRMTLADSFRGQPLVRPNDLIVDRKGGIYFTDPIPDPKIQFRAPPAGRKPLLFYISPDGSLTEATDAVAQPNGVELSPDGSTLYAVDGKRIVAFEVLSNGALRDPRKLAEVAGDGLAMDDRGRLYVATQRGVEIVSASGALLGLIRTPTRIQSMAFGGRDHMMLYAVGGGAVYRLTLLARGVRGRAK